MNYYKTGVKTPISNLFKNKRYLFPINILSVVRIQFVENQLLNNYNSSVTHIGERSRTFKFSIKFMQFNSFISSSVYLENKVEMARFLHMFKHVFFKKPSVRFSLGSKRMCNLRIDFSICESIFLFNSFCPLLYSKKSKLLSMLCSFGVSFIMREPISFFDIRSEGFDYHSWAKRLVFSFNFSSKIEEIFFVTFVEAYFKHSFNAFQKNEYIDTQDQALFVLPALFVYGAK